MLSKSGQCDSHHCTREGQEWLVRELCHTYLSSGARLHVSKGYRQSGRLTTWTCCCWWFDGDIRWWCTAAYPTWCPPVGSEISRSDAESCGRTWSFSNLKFDIWENEGKTLKWTWSHRWNLSHPDARISFKVIDHDFAGKRWRRFTGMTGMPWCVEYVTRIFHPK